MDLPFGGGCACGAIRYECAAPPRYMGAIAPTASRRPAATFCRP